MLYSLYLILCIHPHPPQPPLFVFTPGTVEQPHPFLYIHPKVTLLCLNHNKNHFFYLLWLLWLDTKWHEHALSWFVRQCNHHSCQKVPHIIFFHACQTPPTGVQIQAPAELKKSLAALVSSEKRRCAYINLLFPLYEHCGSIRNSWPHMIDKQLWQWDKQKACMSLSLTVRSERNHAGTDPHCPPITKDVHTWRSRFFFRVTLIDGWFYEYNKVLHSKWDPPSHQGPRKKNWTFFHTPPFEKWKEHAQFPLFFFFDMDLSCKQNQQTCFKFHVKVCFLSIDSCCCNESPHVAFFLGGGTLYSGKHRPLTA